MFCNCGLDLLLGLSKVQRCSLNRCSKRILFPLCIVDCSGYAETDVLLKVFSFTRL